MHSEPLNYRVYSHNIRYDNKDTVEGEKLWKERKIESTASMKFHSQHNNTLVCLQEVLHNQLEDILECLGDDWDYYGVGRDDGKTKGEYAPILFKKSEWKLVKGNTWWLSETPDKPSTGWDAALPRIMTFVRLQHLETGQQVGAVNTHYDHRGEKARRESSKLIMSKMESEMGTDYPITLSGDFNSERKDTAYQTLVQGLDDVGLMLPENERYGHTLTFSGFSDKEKAHYIDFLWIQKDTKVIKPTSFGICENEFHGFRFSDHRPVVADFETS